MTRRKKTREVNAAKEQSSKDKEQPSKASLKNFGVTRPGRETQTNAKPSEYWDLSEDANPSETAVNASSETVPSVEHSQTASSATESAPVSEVFNGPDTAKTPAVAKIGSMIDWSEPPAESKPIAKEIESVPQSKKKSKRQSVLQQLTGQAVPAPHSTADSRPNIEFESSPRDKKTANFEKPNFAAMQAPEVSAPTEVGVQAQAEPAVVEETETEINVPPQAQVAEPEIADEDEIWVPVVGWKPPPRKDTRENTPPAELPAAQIDSSPSTEPTTYGVEEPEIGVSSEESEQVELEQVELEQPPAQPEQIAPALQSETIQTAPGEFQEPFRPEPILFQTGPKLPAFLSEPALAPEQTSAFQTEPSAPVPHPEQPAPYQSEEPPSFQSEPAAPVSQSELTDTGSYWAAPPPTKVSKPEQPEAPKLDPAASYWAAPPSQSPPVQPKPASQSEHQTQTVQSEPQAFSPEPQPFQSAPQAFQSEPQPFQSAPQASQSEPQPIQSAPQPFPSEPQPFQSEPQPFQSAPQPFPSEPQPFQSAPQPFPSEPHAFQSEPQPFQSAPQAFQSEPHAFQSEPVQSEFQADFPTQAILPEKVQRRTIVQEFDITKLVKATERKTQEVKKLEPPPEFDSAMHYFTASAERMTYTAELRFRANYTPAEKKEEVSAPPPESQWNQVGESGANDALGFKFLNDFVPPKQDLPVSTSSGFNMLDLIDEGYRTIQPNPTFSQTRGPGKVEVAVDWVNSGGRLPPVSSRDGLAGGLGSTTSKPSSSQFKKNWLKK